MAPPPAGGAPPEAKPSVSAAAARARRPQCVPTGPAGPSAWARRDPGRDRGGTSRVGLGGPKSRHHAEVTAIQGRVGNGPPSALRHKAEKARAAASGGKGGPSRRRAPPRCGVGRVGGRGSMRTEGLHHESAPLPDLAVALAARAGDGDIAALDRAKRVGRRIKAVGAALRAVRRYGRSPCRYGRARESWPGLGGRPFRRALAEAHWTPPRPVQAPLGVAMAIVEARRRRQSDASCRCLGARRAPPDDATTHRPGRAAPSALRNHLQQRRRFCLLASCSRRAARMRGRRTQSQSISPVAATTGQRCWPSGGGNSWRGREAWVRPLDPLVARRATSWV